MTTSSRAGGRGTPPSIGKCRNGDGAAGFTLLEILIAVALSSGVIALLGYLTQTVGQLRQVIKNPAKEWTVEQFWRGQVLQSVDWLNKEGYIAGEPSHFRFATLKSARQGRDGPPVIAWYWLDTERQRLVYQERDLPAWWPERKTTDLFRSLLGQGPGIALLEGQWWQESVLSSVGEGKFTYLDRQINPYRWEERWSQKDRMPSVIRLEYTRLGRKVALLFESKALFWSTFYGALPPSRPP